MVSKPQAPGRSAYLAFTASSTEEAERIFALLSDDGQIFMPVPETFFAFRCGIFRDKLGTSWMVFHNVRGRRASEKMHKVQGPYRQAMSGTVPNECHNRSVGGA